MLDSAFTQLGRDSENVLTTVVDVRSADAVDAWIDATVAKFGKLDGSANMAGAIGKHHGIRPLIDQDDDEFDMIMRVNVYGLKNCLRAQLRAITKTVGTGSIVNASSVQGLQGFALHAAYSASKHAVTGLTRSVAKEVAPKIRVNAVAPYDLRPLKEIVFRGWLTVVQRIDPDTAPRQGDGNHRWKVDRHQIRPPARWEPG